MALPRGTLPGEAESKEAQVRRGHGLSLIGKPGLLGFSLIQSLSPWACPCQSEQQKGRNPQTGGLVGRKGPLAQVPLG